MKAAWFSLFVFVTGSSYAFGQIDQSDKLTAFQEIRKSMLEIERAFVSRDPEPFERVMLEDYVSIRSRPVFNAREQLLAMVRWDALAIKNRRKLDFETLSYDSESPSVRIVGRTAVINVLKNNLWRYKDSKCLSRYQATEVWIKRVSAWQLLSGHMTTFQCDPMPWQPPHPALSSFASSTKPKAATRPEAELEIRETLRALTNPTLGSRHATDAFSSEFVFTNLKGEVGRDRGFLLNALRTDTNPRSERYRDDEAIQIFDDTAIYLFRLRMNTEPPSSMNISIVLVKQNGEWQIVASHVTSL